jgi:hypothetical protein
VSTGSRADAKISENPTQTRNIIPNISTAYLENDQDSKLKIAPQKLFKRAIRNAIKETEVTAV